MGWVEDRIAQTTPAPRTNYCLDCGKHHERRPFLQTIPAELRALYKAGKYRFPPAPVTTALWDEDAWIRWVDGHGAWER
jgi:hypothetical protein